LNIATKLHDAGVFMDRKDCLVALLARASTFNYTTPYPQSTLSVASPAESLPHPLVRDCT
jgi:hypothetical protein